MRAFWFLLVLGIIVCGGLARWGASTNLRPAATTALGRLQAAARQSPIGTKTSAQESWQEISPGVQMRRWRVNAEGSTVGMVAVRATASRFRVLTGTTQDASNWRRRAGAVAVVNGGFFDTDGKMLGLRIARGKRISALRSADWGVFYVRSGNARILHTRDWAKRSARVNRRVREAIQCGPRLVVNGKVLHFKPQWARRTGLGIMRDGRVILAVSEDEMSFRSWAALWARSDGLNCPNALNLDGGGSTQLAVESAKASYDVGGAWPVPDAVALQ